jgi:uncharacterized OB-fold protein
MTQFFPIPNFDTEIFYNGCKHKKLIFQKCTNCGHIRWPYSFACPVCFEIDTELIEAKGTGKIYTFTIYNVAFHKSFKDKTPYVVAVIKLDEGPKIVGNIIYTPFERIKCDKKVKVVWKKSGDYFLPKFKVI